MITNRIRIIWLSLAIITTLILSTGCLGEVGPSTHTYTVKEKFQTISPCGFASSTDYLVLTTSNETVVIADYCYDYSSDPGMRYYFIWDSIEPGDKIIIITDGYGRPKEVVEK